MSSDHVSPSDSRRPATQHDEPLGWRGRRVLVARVIWLLIATTSVIIFIAGVPLRYRQLLTPCAGEACADGQLTPQAMAALQEAGYSPEALATLIVGVSMMVAIVYVTVGLIIFWRKSHERMAWLASLWLVTFGVTLFEGEVRAIAAAYPWLTLPIYFLILLGGVFLLGLFFMLFPNGRFVPRWGRWAYLVVVIVFPIYGVLELYFRSFFANIVLAGFVMWGGMVLGGVAAQVYRYLRVSGPIERQQTKWVTIGLLAIPLAFFLFFPFSIGALPFAEADLRAATSYALDVTVNALAFCMIPVTIGFSILRYRLWDTDIIINRALVYGSLTAVLALLYFGSVVLFQQVVQALTGHGSQLTIVASTLLTAALFSPLRRRMQAIIDRRFYRRKYDAAQTLARFARVSQDEVELNHLAGELLAAVQRTMQPDAVSLWLREGMNFPSSHNGEENR